tara:strand:- start:236 stop:460 length:225 start_codon:yes stop_codon:yes gene_type:complete
MSMNFKAVKLFNKIDTVVGHCSYCEEEAVLVQLVQDFYRCTNCGEDTKQYINGHIKYLKLSDEDQEWLKRQRSE